MDIATTQHGISWPPLPQAMLCIPTGDLTREAAALLERCLALQHGVYSLQCTDLHWTHHADMPEGEGIHAGR